MESKDFAIDWIQPDRAKKTGTLIMESGKETFTDSLDISKAAARERFVNAVCEKWPTLEQQRLEIDRQLESLAANKTQTGVDPCPNDDEHEIDATHVERPERFITREICGLAVPVLVSNGGIPTGKFSLYLRSGDGQRQQIDLPQYINVSEDRRLWLHPQPPDPTPGMCSQLAGWSKESRAQWLAGESDPDAAELFKELCGQVAKFVYFPSKHSASYIAILALWIVLTYVSQAWPSVPYLYVGGALGSGKSRVFEVLLRLAFRAWSSSNVTAPALFRTLHGQGGTLLFDEAERLKQARSPDVQELLSILLAGYKEGGQATRLEKQGDSFVTTAFDVYGPKALACITGLPPALASRCITIHMLRAAPSSEIPRRRIDAEPQVWAGLRDQLHSLTLSYGSGWLDMARQTDVCPDMVGRDFELWQPLLSLALYFERAGAEGLHDLVLGHAKDTADLAHEDQIPEIDETLLKILADRIRSEDKPTPGEILKVARDKEPDIFKVWSEKGVANSLKRYGLTTNKTAGRRKYGQVSPHMLREIQTNYSIDLGFEDAQEESSVNPV